MQMAESERDGSRRQQVSQLVAAWTNRDWAARDALLPVVYDELHRLAHHYMRGERQGHTLQTTALVNEAYIRLVDLDRMQWRATGLIFRGGATVRGLILLGQITRMVCRQSGAGSSGTSRQHRVHLRLGF